MGFNERLMHTGNRKSVFDNDFGLPKPFFNITPFVKIMNIGIGRRFQSPGQTGIVVNVGVENRGIVFQSLNRIQNCRELFVFHLNKVQGLLGCLAVFRRHRRHPLASESDSILSENREVSVAAPVKNPAHVTARDDGPHPWSRLCPGGVDADNPGVGVRAAQDLGPERPGKHRVNGILFFTGHFRNLSPRNGMSNDAIRQFAPPPDPVTVDPIASTRKIQWISRSHPW